MLREFLEWSANSFAEKYFELLSERKIKGYLFQEKNALGGEKA